MQVVECNRVRCVDPDTGDWTYQITKAQEENTEAVICRKACCFQKLIVTIECLK